MVVRKLAALCLTGLIALATAANADPAVDAARADLVANVSERGEDAPRTILARVKLAQLLVKFGQPDEAFDAVDLALKQTVKHEAARGSEFHVHVLTERAKIAVIGGHLSEAEENFREILKILDTLGGTKDARRADIERSLAIVLAERGQADEARERFASALKILESANAEGGVTGEALLDLASAELTLNDLQAATDAIARALVLIGDRAPRLSAQALVLQGRIAQAESRMEDSERLLREAVALVRPDDLHLAGQAAFNLASTLALRGEGRKAEREFLSALSLIRISLGENHPAVARVLLSLGLLYEDLGQPSRALSFIERSIGVFASAGGERGLPAAEARIEYAMVLNDLNQPERALAELDLAEPALAAAGAHANLRRAYAASARGFVLDRLGQSEEAIASFEQALVGMIAERGEANSDMPPGLISLAGLHRAAGRLEEARTSLNLAKEIIARDRSFTPRLQGRALAAEARLAEAAADNAGARKAIDEIMEMMRARLGAQDDGCGANLGEQRAARELFETVVDVQAWLDDEGVRGRMFEAAQYPHLGETARTLSKSLANTSPEQRELFDLQERACGLERQIYDTLGGIEPGQAGQTLTAELETVRNQIAELASRNPEASVLDPRPASPEALFPVLARDEALLLQLTGATGTHLFLLTGGELHHARTELNAATLKDHVGKLRAAVTIGPQTPYFSLLPEYPFDAAYALYSGVFGPFEDRLPDFDHLIFVPDREMRALPPGMLLASLPEDLPSKFDFGAFAMLDWLAGRMAITILPGPDALLRLREHGTARSTRRPFFGIGDPVLGSDLPEPDPSGEETRDASLDAGLFRSDGLARPAAFRQMSPLPETRDELRRLAILLDADPETDVLVGHAASEARVRTSQELKDAAVIAFATHGFVAGEFGGLDEPALVLSPPDVPSQMDDGLLTLSEVSQLDISADWVILSACNTAAGQSALAEGLSGLARGFMHAGARGLLVSHWYVPSKATAALTVFAAEALSRDPLKNRARALQTAMNRVRKGEHPDSKKYAAHAHPVYWAAFVTVGDV